MGKIPDSSSTGTQQPQTVSSATGYIFHTLPDDADNFVKLGVTNYLKTYLEDTFPNADPGTIVVITGAIETPQNWALIENSSQLVWAKVSDGSIEAISLDDYQSLESAPKQVFADGAIATVGDISGEFERYQFNKANLTWFILPYADLSELAAESAARQSADSALSDEITALEADTTALAAYHEFVTDGVNSQYTLPFTASQPNCDLVIGGVRQSESDYTINGQTLDLIEILPAGLTVFVKAELAIANLQLATDENGNLIIT